MFVGLEFQHQVDTFLNEEIGVAQGNFGAVAIVDGHQMQMFFSCHAVHADADRMRKFRIGRLCGEP